MSSRGNPSLQKTLVGWRKKRLKLAENCPDPNTFQTVYPTSAAAHAKDDLLKNRYASYKFAEKLSTAICAYFEALKCQFKVAADQNHTWQLRFYRIVRSRPHESWPRSVRTAEKLTNSGQIARHRCRR